MVNINSVNLRKTKTVAIVFEPLLEIPKNAFLLGVARYAHEHRNFNVRCMDATEILKGDESFRGCDGIICTMDIPEKVEAMKATGLPIVDISCEKDDPALIGVDIDSERTGVMAAEWFLRRGFKNFAFCGCSALRSSNLIETGFKSVLRGSGLAFSSFAESAPEYNEPDAFLFNRDVMFAALERWIPTLPARTAVLCIHDRRANDMLQMCMRLGRSVPDDIAIMGRGNDVFSCTCAPVAITSIDTNMHGVGYAAMRLLDEVIERPVEPKLRPVFRVRPGAIYERESTAVYPVDPPWLAKILLSLDENLGRQLSMADIAESAGVSQPTLQAAFRKSFGMSAGRYILALRMREAKRLVGEGTLSIKEIAANTGFSSPNYFCRTYRSYYGRPPSEDVGSKHAR